MHTPYQIGEATTILKITVFGASSKPSSLNSANLSQLSILYYNARSVLPKLSELLGHKS